MGLAWPMEEKDQLLRAVGEFDPGPPLVCLADFVEIAQKWKPLHGRGRRAVSNSRALLAATAG